MDHPTGWMFVTRWGNSLLLLPAASCLCASLWLSGERGIARRWALCFGGASTLVLATKLAFLGWGLGIADLDFTGISGHSMLAAAVLPMLAWWSTWEREPVVRRSAVIAASLFALVVGLSRIALSLHSLSEVVVGLLLGTLVALAVVPRDRIGGRRSAFRWVVLAALLVAGVLPGPGDADDAHGFVVKLALLLSGRSEPFERGAFERSHAAPSPAGG